MAYIWFNSVLEALGKRLNFESISNIYGNSFCKEPQKVVLAANPLIKNGGKNPHAGAMVSMLQGKMSVISVKKDSKITANDIFHDKNADLSWADDFIKNPMGDKE